MNTHQIHLGYVLWLRTQWLLPQQLVCGLTEAGGCMCSVLYALGQSGAPVGAETATER